MSSTSKKHRNFVSEPMGNKGVHNVPGIGAALGVRLASNGYDKANQLLGQNLIHGRNKEPFQQWMKEACNANKKQSSDCHEALNEWSGNYLYK